MSLVLGSLAFAVLISGGPLRVAAASVSAAGKSAASGADSAILSEGRGASMKIKTPASLKKDPVAELLKVDPAQTGEYTQVATELAGEIRRKMKSDPNFKKKFEKEVHELSDKDGHIDQEMAMTRFKSGRYNDYLTDLPPTLQFKIAAALIQIQAKAMKEKAQEKTAEKADADKASE